MQGRIAIDEARGLEGSQADLQTLNDSGTHELDVTLIRPTNYTDGRG